MAFLEIPTMICFNFLRKKFSCQLLIKTAAVGFTAKIGICYLAGSVAMIFVAQVFQLVSFALFFAGYGSFYRRGYAQGGSGQRSGARFYNHDHDYHCPFQLDRRHDYRRQRRKDADYGKHAGDCRRGGHYNCSCG